MTVVSAGFKVVADAGHEVHVREREGLIQIEWTCGDVRRFTPEEIAEAVENVRLTAEEHPGVWFQARDHDGESYAVAVVNGELYANTRAGDTVEDAPHVPWRSLRKAIRRTTRDLGKAPA